MRHSASARFWDNYQKLPPDVQELANRTFRLLKANPHHPSLHLKRAGGYWSAQVGIHYRALARGTESGLIWLWIGSHAEYDRLLGGRK